MAVMIAPLLGFMLLVLGHRAWRSISAARRRHYERQRELFHQREREEWRNAGGRE